MRIKSSLLVKIIVPVVLLTGALIAIKSLRTPAPEVIQKNTVADLTAEDLAALGVSGDTHDDTLRTLVGALNQVRREQQRLEARNQQLLKDNQRLGGQERDISTLINQSMATFKSEALQREATLEAEQQTLMSQIQSLTERLLHQGKAAEPESDIPLGLGLDGMGKPGQTPKAGESGLLWVSPSDEKARSPQEMAGGKTGPLFPLTFLEDNPLTRQKAAYDMQVKGHTTEKGKEQDNARPVFTLPENSTLVGARAMTALLGRIPLNGTVTDPYPFKVLIGKDNLTANGIELPEVEGAIVSGTASGDWTLSCVRGQITSFTFVFTDGRIRTLPGADNQRSESKGGIGWLSDDNGIPCISGTRKSNASTYLPTLFALSAAGAAGDALNQSQQTSQTNASGGVTSSLTGDAGQAMLGKAIAGGMNETADWVKQRYGQTFDAIYVPPGINISLHLTRTLHIDYEDEGRLVRHEFTLPGESRQTTGLD